MAPISRLSDDVLRMIFKECYNVMTEDNPCVLHDLIHCTQDHSRQYDWFLLAFVCRKWRAIVLNMPFLWSKFVVGDLRVTQMFLALSKTAPLFIKVPLTAQILPTYEVFKAFPRIRSIELDVKSIVDLNLEPRFPKEAPILQKIVLRNHKAVKRGLGRIQPGEENNGDIPIPGVFDHCPLPSLTSLSIEGFTPDWRNRIFVPTLSNLTVRVTAMNKYGKPEGCILDALDQMKNLRILDLTFEYASLNGLTRQTRQVSLPKLEELALCDSTESCAYLLERLEYPVTTTVCIYITEGGRASPSLPSLLATACSRLSVPGAPQILTVGLWESLDLHGGGRNLAFWDKVVETRVNLSFPHPVKPLFHIEIRCSWDWVALFTLGVSLGPVSNTLVLLIKCGIHYSEDPWEVVKESMPKVHTLHWRPDMAVLERLLSRDILHKSKRTKETKPFFPDLRTLILQGIYFRADAIWALENGLSERKESGRPIRTLELLECEKLDSWIVESVRGSVDQLIWQEEPSGNESGDDYDDGEAELEYGTESSYQSSDEDIPDETAPHPKA
ncbi:hypothetical protein NLI96_g2446 [Meripilus lineatus]|uniref:F-box domain-containing protein n=1 Tax=Meripilus lineatus TaxID=2056292 RepID=A0AAD5VA30_9APHY|nr:hypothetical protein NLI96_g2446 [Physisporinus lineatus]